MRRVWKFLVPIGGEMIFELPELAKVVHFGADPLTGAPAMWVELDPSIPPKSRAFKIMATGESFDIDMAYSGTAVMPDGYVWHLYERKLRAAF